MPEKTLLEPSHQMKWKNTLIGKLHITELKSVKPYHVIRDINRAWTNNSITKFTVMDLGNGMFGFQFEDERDMKWVLDSRPWLVTEDHFYMNQYLLLLIEWCPSTPPSKIVFSDLHPFWVQYHDIPYEYMSREMGKRIGEGTGHEVLDVDFDETNSRRMKSLRVRVLVDVYEKLATGCWLLISKNQPNKVSWVPFIYESLPKFCYGCGIIGHSKDCCSNALSNYESDEDVIEFNPVGVGHESELPAVLAEGQVLRVVDKKAYGHWLYEGIDTDEDEDEEDGDYNGDEEEETDSEDEDMEPEGVLEEDEESDSDYEVIEME